MTQAARRRWQRPIALATAMLLLAAACTSGGDDDPATTDPARTDPPNGPTGGATIVVADHGSDRAPSDVLGVRLSDGAGTTDGELVAVVDGEPLTDDEVAAVVDRLPPWEVPDTDRTDVELPTESLRPPLVGDTVDVPFPPDTDAAPVDGPADGPLQVLRYQPDGDVDVAPFLTVTFDRPMVPLGTLDQLDEADVPVIVEPAVEGRWRWIGARTLRFEVEPDETDRLPAATEYRVEVPAGTAAADGSVLTDAVTWTFTTPTPQVRSFHGDSDSLPLDPVFVAVFDQLVDPGPVLDAITLSAGGDEPPLRLATEDEIDADEQAARVVSGALDGRWVAFRAVDELPADTRVAIDVGPRVPSAEGPRRSDQVESFRGRTYGGLDVVRSECGWGDRCEPGMPFVIEFSNPLDGDTLDAETSTETSTGGAVVVEPAIPGLRVQQYGSTLELSGVTSGRTEYTVTLAGSIGDVFGQTLGDDVERTFRVGAARPSLFGPDQELVTTDPSADRPRLPVVTVNHDRVRLTAWAVDHDDLDEYRRYLDRRWSDTRPDDPPWTVAVDVEVPIDGPDDTPVETAIDLSDAFAASGGPIVVRIEPTEDVMDELGRGDDHWRNRPIVAWVQSPRIGVDAVVDHERLLAWTTDLRTGDPVPGVEVTLLGDGRTVTTDEDGLTSVELGTAEVSGVVARHDGDEAYLPLSGRSTTRTDESRWYVFDDRGVYRPGETVRLTGWVRRLALSADAQLALDDRATEVGFTVYEAQGNEIADGTADLNALGGFNLAFDVPDAANLGTAWIELELIGGPSDRWSQHAFQVQEFRTPEFEVTARQVSAPPFYAAEPATVAVDAEYFAGGPLPDAEVNWTVRTATTTYTPPNWNDFTFGIWQPWWWYDGYGPSHGHHAAHDADWGFEPCFDCPPGADATYAEHVGRTDANGTHHLQIDFDAGTPTDTPTGTPTGTVDLPSTVTAEATVFDVDRQAWASRTDLLVHAARLYVGVRSDRSFVEQGTPLRVDAAVTDVDGSPVGGREVEMTAGRLEWTNVGGRWSEELTDTQTCTLTSTDDPREEPATCEFTTGVGGQYQVTAVVADDDGDRNRSELTLWVSGAATRPSRTVEQEEVTVVPDRETYRPGDVAELLVQAPFAPASGLVTVVRNGILSSEVFDAPDGSAVLTVPIDEAHVPNLGVEVEMVGAAERLADDGTPLPDAPPRPAFASGRIDLSIPPVSRTLDVTATPAAPTLGPGEDTSVTVAVAGPDGRPVEGAQVALVVVDEAVLALTGYELADPLDVFYADVPAWVSTANFRRSIVLDRPDLFDTDGPADGAPVPGAPDEDAAAEAADDAAPGADRLDGADPAIDVRVDFDALAVYAPEETTGADGTVTVDVPLPDNLTRYRVMAVAVDGVDRFGTGESTITARLPLMVRPSAPRLANLGDRFELPVVVQNQTGEPIDVDVVVQTANLDLAGPAGQRVTVPGDDRIEVRFPVTTDEVGTARIRVAAVSDDMADAAAVELPVLTPATAEAFATYGTIDGDEPIGQPLLAPDGVLPGFGGLEIGTSSTALQALTDAVLYLYEYPYDWADGYASRILAVVALRDVLDAFDAEGLPPADELNARVADDIERLAALQNDDGGFPYWQRGRPSVPWVSIQATHALVLADDAGYPVPGDTLGTALDHLADIERHVPSDHSPELRDTLIAYALHVRSLAGDRDTAAATALYGRAGDALEIDALAWLWPLVDAADADEIERTIANRAVETAGAATFATSYGEDAYLIAHSDRRTDGIVLDALLAQQPDSDLIPKVVAGLLGDQVRGRWNNAHENSFILLALKRYFDTAESVTPDFVARAWLGTGDDARFVAEHVHAGRTTDRTATLVPMDLLLDGELDLGFDTDDADLVLAKDGPGRLYYRLGLRYAPADLQLDARDEGFVVDRVYEAVDDPDEVVRNPDGTWEVRAGATVRVRLTMVADARRTHVALIDPLPAGLEPLNPALAVTPAPRPDDPAEPDGPDAWWCWCWNWFEHQNLRDDRAEAFTSYLPGGTYEYTYLARATTPGTFVAPPTRAEEVYAPEVFGRAASTVVTVR